MFTEWDDSMPSWGPDCRSVGKVQSREKPGLTREFGKQPVRLRVYSPCRMAPRPTEGLLPLAGNEVDPCDQSQRDLTEVRGVEEATTRSGQESVKVWSNARASHTRAFLTRGSKAGEGLMAAAGEGPGAGAGARPHKAEEGPMAGCLRRRQTSGMSAPETWASPSW